MAALPAPQGYRLALPSWPQGPPPSGQRAQRLDLAVQLLVGHDGLGDEEVQHQARGVHLRMCMCGGGRGGQLVSVVRRSTCACGGVVVGSWAARKRQHVQRIFQGAAGMLRWPWEGLSPHARPLHSHHHHSPRWQPGVQRSLWGPACKDIASQVQCAVWVWSRTKPAPGMHRTTVVQAACFRARKDHAPC